MIRLAEIAATIAKTAVAKLVMSSRKSTEMAKHADAYDFIIVYNECRNHLITFTWPHSMTSRFS